jgi:hypothetical protein
VSELPTGGRPGRVLPAEVLALRLMKPNRWLTNCSNSPGLNRKHPNDQDHAKNGWATDRPARHVNRTIRFRSIDHRIVPVRNDRLL